MLCGVVGPIFLAMALFADRLAELDDLLKKDLISPEEYATSRQRILGGL